MGFQYLTFEQRPLEGGHYGTFFSIISYENAHKVSMYHVVFSESYGGEPSRACTKSTIYMQKK